jgi:hypothetical protein
MYIRINISGKRRPEKACLKQQAMLKIMVEQKTRREKNTNLPQINSAKKNRNSTISTQSG